MKAWIAGMVALIALLNCEEASYSQTWIQLTNAPNKEWWAITSSADGTRLAASVINGPVYTSTNSGQTWTSNSIATGTWFGMASSSDGAKLAVVNDVWTSNGKGGIYTNSGTTWAASSAPSINVLWTSIACSTNGSTLVASGAAAAGSPANVVYASNDAGNTWHNANLPKLNGTGVASSGDGTKLIALAAQTNIFYSSSDSGTTWVPNLIPSNGWYRVASSADGTKLTAITQITHFTTGDGLIYTSTNSGVTWKPGNAISLDWESVASSADGSVLIACGFDAYGAVYTSTNFGQSWVSNNIPNADPWAAVAASADGSRLFAASATGQIYASVPPSAPLSGQRSGANFMLAWPIANTGFQLQQSSILTTNNWAMVTNSVVTQNGQNQVSVLVTNKQEFYRLINP